ncbi:HAD superfamily hydrolase (TIGR01490 family) [Friedmanniella endophytica]|uniref:HAD superfamily hydrolase (TIGR01490 family) n=1 Tax=Microlunatus kandeliicorticis TaxID=1759536 RepID=A0A7W3IPE4_9ACTN|nr:HAD-IB family hydrolase [Microlunatus kandeliicorticis]MBA8792755.1 HAD superfamily hydrolase (TIGR01490 family) [Microlunatus kandeliicorticis]
MSRPEPSATPGDGPVPEAAQADPAPSPGRRSPTDGTRPARPRKPRRHSFGGHGRRQVARAERRLARAERRVAKAERRRAEAVLSAPRPDTIREAEQAAPTVVPAATPAPIEPDPRAAAFFDVDNTVVQGASMFHLAKGLYRRDFFPMRLIVKGLWLQVWFRLAGRENAGHIEQARQATLGFIAGHTVAEIQEIGEEIYEESIAARIWPGTRAIAQMHLDVGQEVWLVTAAPVEMATIIATRLGMTGALGTTAEHVEGVYTGRLRGELLHGPAKGEAVRRLAAERGLDLERCFAYSDSSNDLPMLTAVGRPSAINPDFRLARHAAREGWQIRDFRTHRRAAKAGLLGTGVAGAAVGAVATALAVRNRIRR